MNVQFNAKLLDDHTAVIDLQGSIDIYTTPPAKEQLLRLIDNGYHHLIINLQKVDYLDSTALGLLIGALKRVREKDGDLRLVAPDKSIQRILEITRLVKVFPIDNSVEEAIDIFISKEKKS